MALMMATLIVSSVGMDLLGGHLSRLGAADPAATTAQAATRPAKPAGREFYVSSKPGSGAGTKEDPFGMADMPGPDGQLTKALQAIEPGDTLWFKGGRYAFKTAPASKLYYLGYLRPSKSGLPGKPISFQACPGETVTLSRAEGGQPILGTSTSGEPLSYVRYEGFVVNGNVYRISGKGVEVAYCEVIGEFANTADNHCGIRLEHADGAWIHHNIIHGWKGKSGNSTGIKIYKSKNLVVEDNWVYDNIRGIFDKDSGINNTYRRNFLTGNQEAQFHGNNQGKYMVAHIYENVIDGTVALGYLTDGTEVHDNLIRGDGLAGHWAGEVWNTKLWNNIVVSRKDAVTAYIEKKNAFVNVGERRHLAYMDFNVYTAAPRYTFADKTFTLDEMRERGFEKSSKVVSSPREVFADEKTYGLLPEWKKAGRSGDAPGPDDVASILDVTRYGPGGRDRKKAE
jgi:hypothetical protein